MKGVMNIGTDNSGSVAIGVKPEAAQMSSALADELKPWLITGGLIICVVFFALGGWASTAPIAQAVVANGTVTVDSQRKRIQHLDGGTIREILVRDGDVVREGDVLVRLDGTRARASLGIVQTNYDAELARFTRLSHEKNQAEELIFPEQLTARAGDPEVDEMLSLQSQLFRARRTALDNGVQILTKQISQLQEKLAGVRAQINSFSEQKKLVDEEVESLARLFEQGFVDKTRLLALQKEAARLEGEKGELVSESAETENAISEKRQEILQVRYDFDRSVVDELRESQTSLLDLQDRLDAARYVADNIEIRAPVQGIVVSLAVFSSGEVVRPGDVVLELVPLDEALNVEAEVRVMDIDNLIIGQKADIRFTAFDTRNTPVLEGTVAYLSADALEDERTGIDYFKVKIDVPAEELDKLGDKVLQPGMPADVIIKTGERTVLQYLYQPISNALAKAWTEQ